MVDFPVVKRPELLAVLVLVVAFLPEFVEASDLRETFIQSALASGKRGLVFSIEGVSEKYYTGSKRERFYHVSEDEAFKARIRLYNTTERTVEGGYYCYVDYVLHPCQLSFDHAAQRHIKLKSGSEPLKGELKIEAPSNGIHDILFAFIQQDRNSSPGPFFHSVKYRFQLAVGEATQKQLRDRLVSRSKPRKGSQDPVFTFLINKRGAKSGVSAQSNGYQAIVLMKKHEQVRVSETTHYLLVTDGPRTPKALYIPGYDGLSANDVWALRIFSPFAMLEPQAGAFTRLNANVDILFPERKEDR